MLSDVSVQKLCESAQEKLKTAVTRIEVFLDVYTLSNLTDCQHEEETVFYKGFLSDLRQLLVFSEVTYEQLGIALRRAHFDVDFAEKVLYSVYHDCVNRFFYPKNESYSEDGRYAYTGQEAIRFRISPVASVRDMIMDITTSYEELRDDLMYYESDYLTQLRMQKRRNHD